MDRRGFLKLVAGGLAILPLQNKIFLPFVFGGGESRRFAIVADTQYWQPQIEEMFALVRARPVEFVIMAGDVVGLENSTGAAEIEAQWQWTKTQLDTLGAWYAVPGNHDLGTAYNKPAKLEASALAVDAWGRYVGPRQFVVDLDYTRIVGVDYSDWSTENQQWIAAQLVTDKRKVVVSHYPLTGVIPKYLNQFDWLDWWSEEKAAFFQTQGVDLFICGHRHQLGMARMGEMTQIICPAVCGVGGDNMPDPAPNGVWPLSYPMRGWLEVVDTLESIVIEVFRPDGVSILSFAV